MKKFSLVLAASLGLLMACNKEKTDSKEVAVETNEERFETNRTEDDAEFAVKAADGGMMEVELGKYAAANAVSQEVKDFGNMMATDHTAAGDELKALAQTKNIALPATLSEDKMKKVNELREKKGADFDKEYMSFMVEDHKEDIEKFTEAANESADPDLKNWAAGKVPVLKKHLEQAERIHNNVK